MNIKQEKHIDIGGKKRLIKFGTNATAEYCDKRNVGLSEYFNLTFDKIKPGELRDIIWSGLVAGARSEGKDVDFDEFNVGDWIDEMDQGELDVIFDLVKGPQEAKKKKQKAS